MQPFQNKFQKLSTIQVNFKDSWINKLFLTFDVDWAHDDIIADCHRIVSESACHTTWFVTHDSRYLKQLRDDPTVELGIHPNFNDLLTMRANESSIKLLQKIKCIVPEATCVRSHSLLQSERLLDEYNKVGLRHVSNMFIPYSSGIQSAPFIIWDGLTVVPHQFQDNVEIRMGLKSFKQQSFSQGFHVFDFHPIHVFLNTESLERYEQTRPLHYEPKELIKYRHVGYGTRNLLIELLELSKIL